MSLWLRSAALARVGLCAAGIPWGRCLLPSEVGITGPAGTQLGLQGLAWLWQGLHLTPIPWPPLPLFPPSRVRDVPGALLPLVQTSLLTAPTGCLSPEGGSVMSQQRDCKAKPLIAGERSWCLHTHFTDGDTESLALRGAPESTG